MKKMKVIVSLLALTLVLGIQTTARAAEETTPAFAITEENVAVEFEQSLIETVCQQVIESYAEYYTIPKITGAVKETEKVDGGIKYTISVSFSKILLFNDASELPYIQGMADAIADIDDQLLKAEVQKKLDIRMHELNTLYIGVEQEENSTFNVFVPTKRSRSITAPKYTVSFVDEFGEISMDAFVPQSREKLRKEGEKSVYLDAIEFVAHAYAATKTNPSSPTDFDRIKARDYVRTYSCGTCKTSPHACRNKDYAFIDGNDCANFVSQAIHHAGIETEDNWNTNTTTWKTTGYSGYGLVDYMVDQGFFFENSEKKEAFAGSIIYWNQYGHVGMVDQNDSITMTYCSHTNDRRSSSFKGWTGANRDTDVKFFVPVWDSYAGRYTPQ